MGEQKKTVRVDDMGAMQNQTAGRALDLRTLAAAYAGGAKPADVIAECHARIAQADVDVVWLYRVPLAEALAKLAAAEKRKAAGESLPLFGVPFAVKDNIDVAGMPTTAACPAFKYTAQKSALLVEKLEAAGAILLGKTNLDQFATGLNGTRSPHGAPTSVFNKDYISGGSSSGSAVAVGNGSVTFALGTDTAGSGRVPAAFNNIVGLKPTKGWFSTTGVVPACRSLDCVSIFAGSVEDASAIARVMAGYDAADPFSRKMPESVPTIPRERFRFGVPKEPLDFFGDAGAEKLYADSVLRLESLGGTKVAIDFAPFKDTSIMLYGGPWVAERLAAIKDFAASHEKDLLPVIQEIVLNARKISAVDAFEGMYKLAELTRRTEAEWAKMDVLLMPTTGTIYRTAEMLADPIRLNSNLGLYTNFTNLLDLSAIAVPAGFRENGLPFGVTLLGRAFQDEDIAAIAARLHAALGKPTIGATGHPVLPLVETKPEVLSGALLLAVVGAHLSGQQLNHELTQRGATLVRAAKTAKGYSLYALLQGAIPKPGLVFDKVGTGEIEVEIWALSASAFGSFVAAIPPPLGIGTVALDDGTSVKCFLSENHAIAGAENITALGGWRAYMKRRAAK